MATASAPVARVSTLELFFDLVFVFASTQLTAALASHPAWARIAEVALLLTLIMWMYSGYAWVTNAFAPNSPGRRALMLTGMAGFLIIALAIPDAYTSAGWAFGLGYLLVTAAHSALFALGGGTSMVRAFRTIAPLNLVSAGIVLTGALLPGDWRWGLWLLAAVLQRTAPYVDPVDRFTIAPSHFVERQGLIIIVALGESLVAFRAEPGEPELGLPLVLVAVLGLSITFLMWWVYFGGDDERAQTALESAAPQQRAGAAFNAYGLAYLGLLAGIVAVAAGLRQAVGHASGQLAPRDATLLAGGLAVFLLADAAFRRVLDIGLARYRTAAAVAAVATVPLGAVSTLGQLAALTAALTVMLVLEDRAARRQEPPAPR